MFSPATPLKISCRGKSPLGHLLRLARDKVLEVVARSDGQDVEAVISEMENGKRPIGKETAKRLASALNMDYRVFL